ncbi:MAG: hypothetical protein ACLVL7_07250 [Anaerotruncus massiliensis (ex Togo et al. 2019)]
MLNALQQIRQQAADSWRRPATSRRSTTCGSNTAEGLTAILKQMGKLGRSAESAARQRGAFGHRGARRAHRRGQGGPARPEAALQPT